MGTLSLWVPEMGISEPLSHCGWLLPLAPSLMSCGLGGNAHGIVVGPPPASCPSGPTPYLPLSSAQEAFRRTLEKEAQGVDPDITVPKFKQRKGESDGAYIQRMEQEAQHVLFLSKNRADQQPEAQVAPKEKSERKKA